MQAQTEPMTVLLLDSEPCLRQAMGRSLGDLGFQVIEANDEQEALGALQLRPDVRLLLLDTHGLGGLEFARYVRERWPDVGLMITSREVRHVPPRDMPGNSSFLPFPIPVDTFLQEVQAVVCRKDT